VNLPVDALIQTAKQSAGNKLIAVTVVDIYTGQGVADDKKVVALNLVYQDAESTLTDEEITASRTKVLATLEAEHGAVLRA
jgi:phenylalanyl-tRNA synthetase beta chain